MRRTAGIREENQAEELRKEMEEMDAARSEIADKFAKLRSEIGQAGSVHPIKRLRRIEERYSSGVERPLGSYAVLMAGYAGGLLTLVSVGRRRRVKLPERMAAADLALLSAGVFRASRLITKDSVTAFARAPFTRFEGPAGEGEVNEEVIAHGPSHAIGELLTCPFCISVWLATVGAFGMVAFPRATRLVCSALSAVAVSDFLQFGHTMLDQATES